MRLSWLPVPTAWTLPQALVVALAWLAPLPLLAQRTALDLSGAWEYQEVTVLTYPPTNTWQATTVPGFLSGNDYERAWFRKVFTVATPPAGSRLKLKFGGVKYNAQVYLNGSLAGTYLNGYEPFELDVTSQALPGAANELIVGVSDWTALFASPVDFASRPADVDVRDYPKTNVLGPIGGRFEQYGIWQPVKLLTVPAVSIADVFVLPSVRTQALTVRLTLRNDSPSPQTVGLTNVVYDALSNAVLTLPTQAVPLPAQGSTNLEISVAWTNARQWSHLDPYLYHLETTLGTSGDKVRTRFGFREFWAEGNKLKLNGIPINLLASSAWPPGALQTTQQMAQVFAEAKNGNNVAIRLHTQPWDEPWYDVADQVGILIVEEFAVWCDPWTYRMSDNLFWTNYAQHLRSAVQRDRNHPSIIMWSMENEILHCGGKTAFAGTEAQLASMGRLVKSLDPTRPITFEADLDPGGEANVLGLHYPYEFPDHSLWPNDAYWMHLPISRNWAPGGQWVWDRVKPLYIGEFLWVPSTSAQDFTILFGDDAYSDRARYRNLAKGMTWQMAIEAYRFYGVNAMCPWTMFEDPAVPSGVFGLNPAQNSLYQAQKAAYHPNGIYPAEYHTRMFAGEPSKRDLRIYNDRMAGGSFALHWRVGADAWQHQYFGLGPAEKTNQVITFNAPAATGPFQLALSLTDNGPVVFTNTLTFQSLPRTALAVPAGTRLGLYDPRGATAALLARSGIGYTPVTNLRTAGLEGFDLLILGQNTLTNDPVPEVGPESTGQRLQDFAERGNWVLVLEQTNYPAWLPAELRLDNRAANFAFPDATHPAMSGVVSNDLRWWAPDHKLVSQSLASPSRGNAQAVVSIGSTQGMESAGAVELRLGAGGFLASQLLLVERFDLEPMAGVLLQKFLNYCASPTAHPPLKPAGLATDSGSAVERKLSELGLLAENLTGRLAQSDPALHPVLVIGGTGIWAEATAQITALGNYVNAGGRLLLHRPASGFLEAAKAALFPTLDYVDANLGLVLRKEASNALVRLKNHDLYWIEQSGTWNRDEVLSTNVATRYYRKRFDLPTYNTIQVEAMPVRTSGGPGTGGWWLWSNGYVATNITVSQSGVYLFNVLARGTIALGVWPHLTLRIDGKAADGISVTTNNPAWFTLAADLTPGSHELSLHFDNDAYNPPEDRNLFLDEVRWGREPEDNPVKLLTGPGVVAQVQRGAGWIVLDEVQWETETRNSVKAARHASGLLTGMGAQMRLPWSLRTEAEDMRNVNVNAYTAGGGLARLNSGGRIETTNYFTTAGWYTFEVVAGGTAAAGVLPQIGVTIDGVTRTNFFCASTNLTRYTVTIQVTAGVHLVGLAFLNDFYAPPEDRNAHLDRMSITPEGALRLTVLETDATEKRLTLQWPARAGRNYEVQVAPNLAPESWQGAATISNTGTSASWTDSGQIGGPPLTAANSNRFYRLRQL